MEILLFQFISHWFIIIMIDNDDIVIVYNVKLHWISQMSQFSTSSQKKQTFRLLHLSEA